MVKDKAVSGGTLVSRTPVTLQSRLRVPPTGYRVEEILPKVLWRPWGERGVEREILDAHRVARSSATLGALYESRPQWLLPAPRVQTGRVTFRAFAEPSGDYSGPISSALLWLEEMEDGVDLEVALKAGIDPASIVIGPRASWKRHKRRKWKVRVAEDPPVRIEVIQGPDLLAHLSAMEQELADASGVLGGGMSQLPGAAVSYFVDSPLSGESYEVTVGPDAAVDVEVQLPIDAGLRAAFAVQVLNLDDGTLVRSEPLFATGVASEVDDDLVVSDLPFDMLPDESRDMLLHLVDHRNEPVSLAGFYGEDVEVTWARLVAATEELGVATVGDAALLAAVTQQGTPAGLLVTGLDA